MIDPSFQETWELVLRPFKMEMDENWSVVRGICVLFLLMTVVLWLASYLAPEVQFARPKRILNRAGWLTFFICVGSYLACVYNAYHIIKERREEHLKNIEKFQD